MKQETREERIKRMIEERNNGQTPVAPVVAPPVSEPVAQDEDEARLISRENEQRIKDASKKSAEIATQGAQVASKLAKEGWIRGLKALEDLKSKAAARAEEKRVAQLQIDTEVEEEQRSVDASDAVSEEQHETLTASKSVRPTWLTAKAAVITVGLAIVGVGAALFVRHQRNEEPIAAVKAIEAPQVESVQVMPIEAVLTEPAPVPPTELPPLPPAAPTVQPALTETVVAPVAPKPIKRPQIAPAPKAPTQKSQPKPVPASATEQEKEWQKDASKKLDEWRF